MDRFIKYNHHGVDVWVRSDLHGTHRDRCLCFSCDKFQGGGKCPIANELYALCVKHHLTAPVGECPEFKKVPQSEIDRQILKRAPWLFAVDPNS